MSNAGNVIAALRSGHDGLAALVSGLGDDDLARPSGASEWDVSQVLSHLGSGADIAGARIEARPGPEFTQAVWDRWNAMTRRERADGFLRADRR